MTEHINDIPRHVADYLTQHGVQAPVNYVPADALADIPPELAAVEGGSVVWQMHLDGDMDYEAAMEYANAHEPVVTSRPGTPAIVLVGTVAVAFAAGTGIIAVGAALLPVIAVGFVLALAVYAITQASKEARQMHRTAAWSGKHRGDAGTAMQVLPILFLLLLLVLILGTGGMFAMAVVGR